MTTHLHKIFLCLQLVQVFGGEYCKEAVETVHFVQLCPTSKAERDIAAKKKNCGEKAAHQGCTTSEKFVYHCVKYGHNKLVEVCAPLRLILGHCAEFNIVGGVIQDQEYFSCVPKCASFYNSSDAYKYPDCYERPRHKPPFPSDNAPTSNRGTIIIAIIVSVVGVIIIGVMIVFFLYRRILSGARNPCTRQDSSNTNEAGQIFELPFVQQNITTISDRHLGNAIAEFFRVFYSSPESQASSNDSAENRTSDEFFDAQS